MKSHAIPCALALLLAPYCGCSSEVDAIGPESPDQVELVAIPSEARPKPEVAIVRGDPPSRLDAFVLQRKVGPQIGAVCTRAPQPEQATEEAPPPVDVCGSRQRVALELQGSALEGEPPCELVAIDGKAFKGMYSAMGCVDGDHLVLSYVCMMCRRPYAGTAAHARLSELTPEQHGHLRKLMGFEGDGPATPAAWRELVAKGTTRAVRVRADP